MELSVFSNEFFMKEALKQAQLAYDAGEVPIGAVVVAENRVIARAHNQMEQLNDVTAHAEMLAITAAANAIGGKYLNECKLFVTLEPCVMCAGAMYWAQIGELHYAASDDKRGYSKQDKNLLHPRTEVSSGLFKEESSALIKQFFERLRE